MDLTGLSNSGAVDLRIATPDGRTIYTTSFAGDKTSINVAGFAPGVYSLTIEKNGAILGVKTFVKG